MLLSLELHERIRHAATFARLVLPPNLSGLSKLREECLELAVAICRFEQGRGTAEEVSEEWADVFLMLQQCEEIVIGVAASLITKLERLERKLELTPGATPLSEPTDSDLETIFRDFADGENVKSWRRKVWMRCAQDWLVRNG